MSKFFVVTLEIKNLIYFFIISLFHYKYDCDYIMNCILPNPANILISYQNPIEKMYLLDHLFETMNYSDTWIYSQTNNIYSHGNIRTNKINSLNQFILDIINKKYVSDCLTILIDEPRNRDIKSIQKLLKISKTYDIIVIITNFGQLRNKSKIIKYIEVECIFKVSMDICGSIYKHISTIPSRINQSNILMSLYHELNQNEFVYIDYVNNFISKECLTQL